MPELPEVETTRLGLLPLIGKTVETVVIRFPMLRWPIPKSLISELPNQTLRNVSRRAKYLLCEFDTGVLMIHLGMSGRIRLLDDLYPHEKHDHFDVQFADKFVLRLHDPRRFGAVLWINNKDHQHPLLKALGPEPLSEFFDAQYLQQTLCNKTLAIKNAIMDSHVVVGVGNIYASESLFRAAIHPERHANSLTIKEYSRLVDEIKATLNDALKAGGSSLRDFFGTDGKPGYFQQAYYVYGRADEPCKSCGKNILNIRLGQRSTFFCQNCQQ